jgi:methylase of polypeptide subunit release factors
MTFTTVRIEGSIFTADILEKIAQEELKGQVPGDFGFKKGIKVKDEIASAWADAQAQWRIFKHRQERVDRDKSGASETRQSWMIPFLSFLGYDARHSPRAEMVNNQTYAISHHDPSIKGFPIHIMGFNDSLDKKRQEGGPRMSPHGLVQEYLNLTEHLYAFVTNGIYLRLLRDSSRLVKLSFLEFDLRTMMEDEHYADFALMFRLFHASRMPQAPEQGPDSLIETYHQDSLDSGARIREGLSEAVETAIRTLADGFLNHPANTLLLEEIDRGKITPHDFYQYMLRLIYRLLFLMVIEERHLIYANGTKQRNRDIYYKYYSVSQLRKRCESLRHLQDSNSDLWVGLLHTFRLFESEEKGKYLDIKPLCGDLFDPNAIGMLHRCRLENQVLLAALRGLSLFENKNTGQMMRVNYGSLNVEEFGSVYEGLLEYDPVFGTEKSHKAFRFVKGSERSASGSHYTPDELVQPLIKHSLEHVIEEKLKEPGKERALLSIRVCDVACGSGHILLNAARRIGTELARVRTGEEQPSPTAARKGVRDAISHCIYGVDKNPLAVELCKVALWLEAHNPGEPLNFLDHHIKCGDSIVGLAHMEELEKGIPDEAFKKMPGDDAEVLKELAKINRKQRQEGLAVLKDMRTVAESMTNISALYQRFNALPERTVEEIAYKAGEFKRFITGPQYRMIKTLANLQVAQFFIPKTEEYRHLLVTHSQYRAYLQGNLPLPGNLEEDIDRISDKRVFFHWFLEFPDVFAKGGFDCILGNPPFLGNRKIKSILGADYLEWVKYCYAPAGAIELVGYFFRRSFSLIKPSGFQSLIATNTISQGAAREGGLEVIEKKGGTIKFAIRSMKWPGLAAVDVSLISIIKGNWNREYILNNKRVERITSFLDDSEKTVNAFILKQNKDKSFVGSYVLGKGFILQPEEAHKLIENSLENKKVLYPYLNGDDLNSRPDQSPSRWVINFFDWQEEKCKNEYPDCFEIIEKRVRPERQRKNDKGEYVLRKPLPQRWWQYGDKRPKLYATIKTIKKVLAISEVTKYCKFSFISTNFVYMHTLKLISTDSSKIQMILNSSIHEYWAWKYSSTMGGVCLRYTPSSAFETFPFPQNLSPEMEQELEQIGEEYHEFRRQIMLKLELGLTKTYNLFHCKDLTVEQIKKQSKKDQNTCETGFRDILKLRELHQQMDEAVLRAYSWTDIDLAHDFYEVDYLPENDRIRYTISPQARKEILKRLLDLNHKIHEQEIKEGLAETKPGKKDNNAKEPAEHDFGPGNLFTNRKRE